MQMLVLSSYVVDNAKANVGFNRKFLKLATSCCEKTVFVTSNYPEELLEGLPGLTVENLRRQRVWREFDETVNAFLQGGREP